MNKDKKRLRSKKEQIKYQQSTIRKKLEEFLQNPYPHSFLTFFEEICEYCANMSQEECKKLGKKFINYKDKDELRKEQDRFQKTLKKIGYKREKNQILELLTKTEKDYFTMLYAALYYKHNIQLYSFKISGTSAFKIDRELGIYKELLEKDLYIVMMFFKPFSSSQYIMETLQKLFEKDCLGIGAFMGGVYIIFKELKKQKDFVDIMNNLIKEGKYKNVKIC